MSKKKQSLQERIKQAREERKLESREGHEISADGKELRTPTPEEFFGALERVSKPEKK